MEAHGNLKRSGREWKGPCPVCGGEDRFYVLPDGYFYCRQCLPDSGNFARFMEILKVLGFVEDGKPRPPRWKKVSPAELEAKERKRRRRARQAIAMAHEILGESEFSTHPYLEAKGHPNHQGYVYRSPDDARFRPGKLLLLIPVMDHKKSLLSLQTIDESGRKKFLPGSLVTGGRFTMGAKAFVRRRWYVEGFVTALSMRLVLRELRHDDGVVVCFSDHGVKSLAALDARAFVIADNDKSGAGERAAERSGRPWWMPPDVGTDANDYHLEYGIEALVQAVRELIREDEGEGLTT